MNHTRFIVGLALGVAIVFAAVAAPASALVPDGGHGWFWQMPQPAGGLKAVAFPAPGQVWAVGGSGLILHSTDGGASWAAQPTASEADLVSVSFVDDQHGWACGAVSANGSSAGALLVTTNGGGTWTDTTPSGLTSSLTSVWFADSANGWAGTGGGGVLRTTDGGATWGQSQLGDYTGPVVVNFSDAMHGCAGGAALTWWTTDGGATWLPGRGCPSWGTISQLAFADRAHGWALAYWGYFDDAEVLTTSDGGRHWHNAGQPAYGLCVTGARSALTVDWGFTDLATDSVLVGRTTDRGTHWQTTTVYAPSSVSAVACRGNQVCAVGNGILVSSDAGSTWQAASSGQQYLFMGADAVSATDVWAVDYAGALVHSSDGVHWVEKATPARYSDILRGIDFPDTQNGWAVGTTDFWGDGSVILHTSDGGQTWSPQASNLTSELVGVDFIDDSIGWAICDSPFPFGVGAPLPIEHTIDGGANWIPQYVDSSAGLIGVDFISATTGWACGYYQPGNDTIPAIWATTDGGYLWKRGTLPKGAPVITGVQFVDATHGWAVGTGYDDNYDMVAGWVLTSSDAGRTWKRVSALDDSLPSTVHFADPQHGWIGGFNGVWATTDGGASWQHVAAGSVRAITASDPTHVWGFGLGTLISTVDAAGDSSAPATVVVPPNAYWHREPLTVDLPATDLGGSGVASTESSTDGGATWQNATRVTVAAPPDHANDGSHTIFFRATDNAGNREQTEALSVGIDTLGPTCSVPRPSVVNRGESGGLYFMAQDALSGVRVVTVSIVAGDGRVVRRFVERAGRWGMSPSPPFYYLLFTCDLPVGTYRTVVTGVDYAGNRQVLVGHGRLRVVSGGAPAFHRPWWPPGLPVSAQGFSARKSAVQERLRLPRILRGTSEGSQPAAGGVGAIAAFAAIAPRR